MKKSDLSMVILVAFISIVAAFFLSNTLFGNLKEQSVDVKTIDTYSAEFIKPDIKVFNKEAINPTIDVIVDPEKPE